MSNCIILDGGYHGEKLHDTEYLSCHENCDHKESFPFQKEIIDLIKTIGQMLTDYGYDVYYTRCDDTLMTPSQVAELANNGLCHGDKNLPYQNCCLLSFHRTLIHCPGQEKNAEIFVYQRNTPASRLAYSIMDELTTIGYRSLGINERPNLTILRRTLMASLFITLGNLPLSSETEEENYKLIMETAEAFFKGIISSFETSL